MSEKNLERKLRERVHHMGGWAVKFFSSTTTGLPDRIILMPGARVFFAELKSDGKKPSPRQRIVHTLLRKLGFTVSVISNDEELTDFLNLVKSEKIG